MIEQLTVANFFLYLFGLYGFLVINVLILDKIIPDGDEKDT